MSCRKHLNILLLGTIILTNPHFKMKKLLSFAFAASTLAAFGQGLPTNPEPGKCYVKCVTHDEFKPEDVRVLVTPEYKKITVIPAKFKSVTEKVLIKEEAKKMIYHPAEFETTNVSYVSKADATTLKVNPAVLGNSSERIETMPKTANWEYTSYSECTSPNPEDCQTLCYVEQPADYQTVPTQTLTSDAKVITNPAPGASSTYKKQVVKKPAYVEEVLIPAVYGTITKQVVDVPAREEVTVIPAVYKTVSKQVLVKKGGVNSWEEIDCALVQSNELNIIWNLGSATLTSAAKSEISNVLLPMLKETPAMSVELSSHTDSRGSDEFNRALSQRRADAVKSYLVANGITSSRLVSKGYGETKLRNNCSNGVQCSEPQHQANRRTEYRVINR